MRGIDTGEPEMGRIDPNLLKIMEANIGRVHRGRLARPIIQGKDYLERILGHDSDQINVELDEFVAYMQSLEQKAIADKKRKQKQRKFGK